MAAARLALKLVDTEEELAVAKERVMKLEAALRRCNEAATAEGNDERRLGPGERNVARGIGAIIRSEMTQLGIE